MSGKTILVLFVVFSLLTSLDINTTFADTADDKKKKTFEQMCAKKKGNEPDALFCQAILDLQHNLSSFFDIITELRTTDTNLQTQINSFFDIFVELDNVADKQCPQGQVATGTNIDGSLICTDLTQNQDCDDGYYMYGIDEDGQIKCKPLPSGSNFPICGNGIMESPEQCDDGISNSNLGSCSTTCTIQTPDLCSGANTNDGHQCTIDACDSNTGTVIHTNLPVGTTCNESGGSFCDGAGSCVTTEVCGNGILESGETCDDENLNPGDGCSALCQVETGFSCVGNPSVCSAVCGDGMITGTEQCDGADLNGLSCIDQGFLSGTLSCSSSCTIDISGCGDNFTGVFSVTPTINYQCADVGFGPFVNINTSQLVVTHDVSTNDVTVSGLPVLLDGSATASGFSSSGTISGACTETYQLDASFTNADTFSGTLYLSFSGSSCMDCTNQSFLVTGTRNN